MSLTNENGGTQFTIPMTPAGGYGGMGGFGGDGWWGILFLIAIMCGGWGGFGGFGGMGGMMMWPWLFGGFGNGMGSGSAAAQGALTREQACIDNNFNNLGRTVESIANAVNQGFQTVDTRVCQQQYETAQQINGLGNIVQQGFSQAELARCNQQALLMQQLNAMQAADQQCCCDVRQDINNVRFTIAQEDCNTRNTIQNNTRDIIDSQNNGFRAILDKMCQQEIAAKDAQIAAQNQKIFGLELAASQAAQNNYLISRLNPTPVPAYPAASPCGLGNWSPSVLAGGYGYNGGCGCCA